MKTAFFSHPTFLLHDTGPGHPERPARLQAIEKYLRQVEIWPRLAHLPFEAATEDQLEACHLLTHISRVRLIAEKGGGALDGDTIVSPASFEAAKLAAGAAIAGVDAVFSGQFRNAFAAVRPCGHHAESGRRPLAKWGFCLFNNVAVAARHAQKKQGAERVAILDFDVHHGNGTQEIFQHDPTVFFASLHEWGIFPGSGSAEERGAGNIFNFPLPAHSDGATYRRVWQKVGVELEKFRPDLILLSAGYDAHLGDPLAHMALVATDYVFLIEEAKKWAEKLCAGRLVAVLEGGYNLNALAEAVAATLVVMMDDE